MVKLKKGKKPCFLPLSKEIMISVGCSHCHDYDAYGSRARYSGAGDSSHCHIYACSVVRRPTLPQGRMRS